MRLASRLFLVILLLPLLTSAQETHKPEEWQKLYEDASNQLRAAQDRKAQLSNENTHLADQVKDLQRQLQQATAQNNALKSQSDALNAFLKTDPCIRFCWDAFLTDDSPLDAPQSFWFHDPQWPLSSRS